jgi:hypothetical protein
MFSVVNLTRHRTEVNLHLFKRKLCHKFGQRGMRSENSFRFQLSSSKYKDSASSSQNVNRMVVKVRIDPRITALPHEIFGEWEQAAKQRRLRYVGSRA